MTKEILYEVSSVQHIDESSLQISPVEGGFTGTAKYIIEGQSVEGTPVNLFAKVVDAATHSTEMAVLGTEAKMYGVLTDLGLTGKYFPRFRGYTRTPSEHALLIDYLPDVSWGGPWNHANIEKLSASINAVHNTSLTDGDAEHVKQIADELTQTLESGSASNFDEEGKNRLFHDAWHKDDNSFVNSRGVIYFSASSSEGISALLETEATYDKNNPPRLILKDLNFGNLAVASDRVYFVDPVYLSIGNPAFDLAVLGVNMLRNLPDEPGDSSLRELVKSNFLQDKAALAHLIKYWVACTSLPLTDSQNAWMDFQQSCAVTALQVWEELTA